MKILGLILGFLIATPAFAETPDWSAYEQVLKQVKPGQKHGIKLNLVNYAGIVKDGSLQRAYQNLSTFNVSQLKSRDERLAFYINAYNILALKMVADHWPVESIKDIGNLFSPVWNKPAGSVAGKTVTLAEIEHQILRPMGEPRIHLAIVCASVSCPDLRTEPYRPAKLSMQLDDQVVRFLNTPGKGLKIEGDVIRVSKIFDWFEEDFAKKGGVDVFIRHYQPDLKKLPIKQNLPYDWSLNAME